MSSYSLNGKLRAKATVDDDFDPELLAEQEYAKEHGLPVPKKLPSAPSTATSDSHVDRPSRPASTGSGASGDASCSSRANSQPAPGSQPTNGREKKALRKKRSRGVSGSSIKKDGGRFDLGLDDYDLDEVYAMDELSDDDLIGDLSPRGDHLSEQYKSLRLSETESDPSLSEDERKMINDGASALLLNAEEPRTRRLAADEFTALLMQVYGESSRAEFAIRALEAALIRAVQLAPQCPHVEYELLRVLSTLVSIGVVSKDALVNAARSLNRVPSLGLGNVCTETPILRYLRLSDRLPDPFELPMGLNELAKEFAERSSNTALIFDTVEQLPYYYHSEFYFQILMLAWKSANVHVMSHVCEGLKELSEGRLCLYAVCIAFNRLYALADDMEQETEGMKSMLNVLTSIAGDQFDLLSAKTYADCPRPNKFLKGHAKSGKLSVWEGRESECEYNTFVEYID